MPWWRRKPKTAQHRAPEVLGVPQALDWREDCFRKWRDAAPDVDWLNDRSKWQAPPIAAPFTPARYVTNGWADDQQSRQPVYWPSDDPGTSRGEDRLSW